MHDYDVHEAVYLDWEIHDPLQLGKANMVT